MYQQFFPWWQFPTPGPGPGPGPGQDQNLFQKAQRLVGRPVGVSLRSGQGVSGVLCRVTRNEIQMIQYLYQQQFATFRYDWNQIRDIHPFPPCGGGGGGGTGPYY